MDFTFSDDQLLFRDSVRDFLRAEITTDRIREGWETETGRSETLWRRMAEMGLTAMLVPEAFGGLGMNDLDFILLAQECGYVALPEPLVTVAMVATPLLAALAEKNQRCAELLRQITTGEARVAIGHTASDLVSDAHIADWLLWPRGNEIHLIPRDELKLTAQPSVDPSRKLFSVEWEPKGDSLLCEGAEGIALLAATLNRGALGMAAQLVGLAEAMVEMTVKYTADRHQFGRPIGANQALKHAMADCAVKIEFAKPVLYRAAYVVAQNPKHSDFAVSHAKVSASGAALLAAKNCIQAHGAMGYTWECDLHIFMKRAWALDKSWGHNGFHKNRLHQWLMNPGAKIGANMTFGPQA